MSMAAVIVAAHTADAESAAFFGPVEWVRAAEMLLDYGFTDDETVFVLRSRWMARCRETFDDPQFYVADLFRIVSGLTRGQVLSDLD